VRTGALALALSWSCSRAAPPSDLLDGSPLLSSTAAPSDSSAPHTEASAATETKSGAEDTPAADLPLPAREARRFTLRRLSDEAALAPQEALVAKHFDGGVPALLEAQLTPLGGDRRAYLVYGEARRRQPMLLVTTPRGELAWTKERPLAGTRQVVTEMVVAPGPHGEVALLWCDIPTQIVGLRRWAHDGTVLADFEVLEVEVCDALAALYWPGRGWIAVASQHGAARAQLLEERGTRAWGPKGVELPWVARPSAAASIAVDSDASAIVFQVGDLARGDTAVPDRVLAMRYDALGARAWERPLDLGPALAGSSARIYVHPQERDRVKVSLGARGEVTVTSAGAILGAR
jgi:hypothetical protein